MITTLNSPLPITQFFYFKRYYVIATPLTYTRAGTLQDISKSSIYRLSKSKSLKDILVRAKVHLNKETQGFMNHTKNRDKKFVSKLWVLIVLNRQGHNRPTYIIRQENLKCSSQNEEYLFTCKTCSKQYTRSTEEFWPATTFEGEKVKQESFNIHFAEVNHNGEENEVNWPNQ